MNVSKSVEIRLSQDEVKEAILRYLEEECDEYIRGGSLVIYQNDEGGAGYLIQLESDGSN